MKIVVAGNEVIVDYRDEADPADYANFNGTVLLNSVITTLPENAGEKFIRFNGWPGFAEKAIWECAGEETEETKAIAEALGKKFIFVPDQPGLITPRMLAMIINEAHYAAGEAVASESDIDVAMKLGTNYPAGPFEWCEQIGKEKIISLLTTLASENERYLPSAALSASSTDAL